MRNVVGVGAEPLLRLDQVAERLAVSMSTVRRLAKDGRLRVVRVGRALRVRPQDLDAFILGSVESGDAHA